MKIVIDARLYGLENGGIGRYTIELIQNLANLDNINQYQVLLTSYYCKKLNLPDNWTKIEADFKQYSIAEQYKLPKLLKNLDYDLVHFLHFNIPYRFRGKFIVTIHDLIMHSSKGRQTTTKAFYIYPFKRLGYKAIFKKAVKDSTKIIVPTEFIKNEIVKIYQVNTEKINVVYEGVEQRVDSNKIRANVALKYDLNRPFFIYTGSTYPHKNLERAVEAVVHLNKVLGISVLLAIVSSKNEFSSRLENFIQKNNAKDYIKMLGFVPDTELNILYKLSLGFLYPSLYEGFGLPGLEAMASGTITLCSDIPVFREVYQKGAVYFNPYDFTSIAGAMKKVAEMSDIERKAQIKIGKIQSKKYSWSKMARQTLELYEKSLSN